MTSPAIFQALQAVDQDAWLLVLRVEQARLNARGQPVDPQLNYVQMRTDLSADEAERQAGTFAELRVARTRFYGLNPRLALLHLNLLLIFRARGWIMGRNPPSRSAARAWR